MGSRGRMHHVPEQVLIGVRTDRRRRRTGCRCEVQTLQAGGFDVAEAIRCRTPHHLVEQAEGVEAQHLELGDPGEGPQGLVDRLVERDAVLARSFLRLRAEGRHHRHRADVRQGGHHELARAQPDQPADHAGHVPRRLDQAGAGGVGTAHLGEAQHVLQVVRARPHQIQRRGVGTAPGEPVAVAPELSGETEGREVGRPREGRQTVGVDVEGVVARPRPAHGKVRTARQRRRGELPGKAQLVPQALGIHRTIGEGPLGIGGRHRDREAAGHGIGLTGPRIQVARIGQAVAEYVQARRQRVGACRQHAQGDARHRHRRCATARFDGWGHGAPPV